METNSRLLQSRRKLKALEGDLPQRAVVSVNYQKYPQSKMRSHVVRLYGETEDVFIGIGRWFFPNYFIMFLDPYEKIINFTGNNCQSEECLRDRSV